MEGNAKKDRKINMPLSKKLNIYQEKEDKVLPQ
jgi:hypothetical protein